MSSVMLARDFSAKARANAEFVLAALEGLGRDALAVVGGVPGLRLQVANQLVMEGIELGLKAFLLAHGSAPKREHRLASLYAKLDAADRSLVDETVRSAVAQSASGPMPFGLPNVASAMLRDSVSLGQSDPAAGYEDMGAEAFFRLLDTQWGSRNSQYLGADSNFVVRGVLRTNSRLLAGGILVCLGLAGRFAGTEPRASE